MKKIFGRKKDGGDERGSRSSRGSTDRQSKGPSSSSPSSPRESIAPSPVAGPSKAMDAYLEPAEPKKSPQVASSPTSRASAAASSNSAVTSKVQPSTSSSMGAVPKLDPSSATAPTSSASGEKRSPRKHRPHRRTSAAASAESVSAAADVSEAPKPVRTSASGPTTPPTKPKKRAARRKAPQEKKRESFYASDRFRKQEATERDETAELAVLETPTELQDEYRVLPAEVARALAELRDVAREADTEVLTPEYVVLGLQGHGKSSVVEAILGWPIMHVEFGNHAMRPIHISVQNNPQHTEPLFTLMSDPSLGIKKRQAYSDYEELRKEMSLRVGHTKDLLRTPVHLLIEHAEALNFDVTECPGFSPFNMDDAAVSLVKELAGPVHKRLIVVEECIEWENVNCVLLQTVLQLDPNFSRTVFVHTKLNTMLQGMYNAGSVSRYFAGIERVHSAPNSFWVTVLSKPCRDGCKNVDEYRHRLMQARQRDLKELSYLQYNTRYTEFIGATKLRAHILRHAAAQVRAAVPQIMYALQLQDQSTATALRKVAERLDEDVDGEASEAKAYAMNFVNGFLASIENALSGSLNMDPALHGQTAAEEGKILWRDPDNDQTEARLVGAQQFQRLLQEARHVVGAFDFDKILPVEEHPDPEGSVRSDQANALASEMAFDALAQSFKPLVTQACDRAEAILTHAFHVYNSVYSVSVSEHNEADPRRFVLANSPYFRNLIADKFKRFLLEQRGELEADLLAGLMSPQTYCWSLLSFPERYAPPKTKDRMAHAVEIKHGETTKKTVVHDKYAGLPEEAIAEIQRVQAEQATKLMRPRAIAKRLFAIQRARLLQDVSLKFYRHLLDPLSSDLAQLLRNCVSDLTVDQTELLFDFASSIEMQARRRKRLERISDSLRESRDTYDKASLTYLELVSPVN